MKDFLRKQYQEVFDEIIYLKNTCRSLQISSQVYWRKMNRAIKELKSLGPTKKSLDFIQIIIFI